ILFFFSSRRRHTRFSRDWSSDVCSSDLMKKKPPQPVEPGSYKSAVVILLTDGQANTGPDPIDMARLAADRGVRVFTVGVGTEERSEERRVGKGDEDGGRQERRIKKTSRV